MEEAPWELTNNLTVLQFVRLDFLQKRSRGKFLGPRTYTQWREEANFSNSSSIGFYHILLNRYSEFTRQLQARLRLWIVTDPPVLSAPAERTSKPVLRSWAGARDSRKEIKILSRAADHHSRFGREPSKRFLPFSFPRSLALAFSSSSFPSASTGFRARNTVDLHAISYRLSPIESAATSRRIDGRSLQQRAIGQETRECPVAKVARFTETVWNWYYN